MVDCRKPKDPGLGRLGASLVFLLTWTLTPWAEGQGLNNDPLPLRRVLIPAERVPLELERVRQGVLVQLPLSEFEAQVKKAAQAEKANKLVPNLVRATYRAELSGQSLV